MAIARNSGVSIPDIHQKVGAGVRRGEPKGWTAITAIGSPSELNGLNTERVSQISFQFVGITTGTFVPQGTINNTNFVAIELKDGSGMAVTSVTANGIYFLEAAKFSQVRFDVTVDTTINVDISVIMTTY